jgi:hypothetical protein
MLSIATIQLSITNINSSQVIAPSTGIQCHSRGGESSYHTDDGIDKADHQYIAAGMSVHPSHVARNKT